MQTKILLLIIMIINPIVLFSQAAISYITPDIGAKGHSQYLEIIGPHDSHGSFGEDGIYVNGINTDDPSGDVVIVETVDPADSNKITFGPVMVNWDGRMVSTYVFVNPNMSTPNTSDWETLNNEFIIDIRVRVNGAASNSKKFYILRPFTFGDISGNPSREFGRLPLGKRSPGGAMIVDDLTLADDTYIVNTDDCDPNTPGNQGFLPFTLISLNEIKGSGTNTVIDVSGTAGDTQTSGGNGGPGGGGGGGRFCDLNAISQAGYRGDDGGNGFTGGGRGGFNDNSNPLPPPSGYKSWGGGSGLGPGNEVGYSLNGVPRPGEGAYEASGGGTGHPFGRSGEGTWDAVNGNPIGYYGGGSGYRQNSYGGGGGYARDGEGNDDTYGKAHGNVWGIPLAGGSGGASGNPEVSLGGCAGSGGGGGGAIAVFANRFESIAIHANGGDGEDGEGNSHGGGGSGGYIGVYSKLDANINEIFARFGDGGNNTTNARGGVGYYRIDRDGGNNTSVNGEGTPGGLLTDTTRYVSKNFSLDGINTPGYEPFDVYIKGTSTNWQLLKTVDAPIHQWTENFTLPGDDDMYYLAIVQKIPEAERVTGEYLNDPVAVMSHAATNILLVESLPVIASDTVFINDDINCKPPVKKTFLFPIYNIGDEDLIVRFDNANFDDGTKGFSLISPAGIETIKPGDSVEVRVEYNYIGVDTDLSDVLYLLHNDPINKKPWEIRFQVEDVIETYLELISGTTDFGEVKVNAEADIDFVYENKGTAAALINPGMITVTGSDFAIINIQPALPAYIKPGETITITVRFNPNSVKDFTANLNLVSTISDSSCSFNNTTFLEGKGIQSTVELNKYQFDFGIVPYCETVQDTLYVRNPTSSTAPFSLLSVPEIVEDSDPSHMTYFGIQQLDMGDVFPKELMPSEEVGFIITFTPDKNKGVKSVIIEIETNDANNPLLVVPVSAEIEVFDVTAQPASFDFGDVWVGFDYTDNFDLSNAGEMRKYIATETSSTAAITINNVNSESYIDVASTIDYTIDFRPTQGAAINENIKIFFGSPCSDSIIIPITANGLLSEVTSPDTLDFGMLSSCSNSIMSIEYSNFSDAPFILLDERFEDPNSIFEINLSDFTPNDTVYPGQNNTRLLKEYFVQGQGKAAGIYYARYITEIYSNGVMIEDTVVLKVEIQPGEYDIVDSPLIFEDTFLNESDEKTLTFTNSGPWPITITSLNGAVTPEFEILNFPTLPYDLAVGESLILNLRFTPVDSVVYQDVITFEFEMPDCEFTENVTLQGYGDPLMDLFIIMPDLVDVPPDIDDYSIPIFAKFERASGSITNFTLDSLVLSFNRTMFFPTGIDDGVIMTNEIEGGNRVISFSIKNITIPENTIDSIPIAYLHGFTMLANEESSELKLSEPRWQGLKDIIDVVPVSGSMDIEICEESTDRLLQRTDNLPLINITPNPAANSMKITLNALEAGKNVIDIISVTGDAKRIAVYNKGIDEVDEKEFQIDLDEFASGVYYLRLRSKSLSIIEPVYIIK